VTLRMQNTFFFLLHKTHEMKINTIYYHINATNGTLHDAVHKLPLCYLLSKSHTVSQCVHSIISLRPKDRVFPSPCQFSWNSQILKSIKYRYSCTEFHWNYTI